MLLIKTNDTIYEVQKKFDTYFPFLKIGFFNHNHSVNGASYKRDLLKTDVILKHIQKEKSKSQITITEDMAVGLLEELFSEIFGLSAQVFRKSGQSWLETTVTDDWTLKRQNEEGEELSKLNVSPIKKEEPKPGPYYL